MRRPADCHPEKPSFVRGLCGACYARMRREEPEWRERINARKRKRYAEDPEFRAKTLAAANARGAANYASHIKRTYGIDIAEYEAALAEQQGRCAICRKSQQGRRLVVDHDHETGAVRGLLCVRCNVGIGSLYESPEVLIAAAAYLCG